MKRCLTAIARCAVGLVLSAGMIESACGQGAKSQPRPAAVLFQHPKGIDFGLSEPATVVNGDVLLAFADKEQDASEDRTTLQGVVKSFRENPKGDVDGLVMDDATEIRFPPHVGASVTEVIDLGDPIEVTGRKHRGPKGDSHFRAVAIKNVKTGKSVDADAPPPKKPQRDAQTDEAKAKRSPPHEQMLDEIRAIRALVEDKPAKKTQRDGRKGPPHEQVLRELRELRKLVEKRVESRR